MWVQQSAFSIFGLRCSVRRPFAPPSCISQPTIKQTSCSTLPECDPSFQGPIWAIHDPLFLIALFQGRLTPKLGRQRKASIDGRDPTAGPADGRRRAHPERTPHRDRAGESIPYFMAVGRLILGESSVSGDARLISDFDTISEEVLTAQPRDMILYPTRMLRQRPSPSVTGVLNRVEKDCSAKAVLFYLFRNFSNLCSMRLCCCLHQSPLGTFCSDILAPCLYTVSSCLIC